MSSMSTRYEPISASLSLFHPFFLSLPHLLSTLPLPFPPSPPSSPSLFLSLPPSPPPSSQLLTLQAEGRKWYDPRTYLQNPSCKDDVISQRSSRTFTSGKMDISTSPVHITRSFRETIHVSTLTCSTKLTQTSMCVGVWVCGCVGCEGVRVCGLWVCVGVFLGDQVSTLTCSTKLTQACVWV